MKKKEPGKIRMLQWVEAGGRGEEARSQCHGEERRRHEMRWVAKCFIRTVK